VDGSGGENGMVTGHELNSLVVNARTQRPEAEELPTGRLKVRL
jgi:hypothetical protein